MLQGISAVLGIVNICCYLFVIYQMFANAETVIGIVCLVGACVLGLGALVAFVYGWIKARDWEIVPVMATWSVCIAANIVIAIIQVASRG